MLPSYERDQGVKVRSQGQRGVEADLRRALEAEAERRGITEDEEKNRGEMAEEAL